MGEPNNATVWFEKVWSEMPDLVKQATTKTVAEVFFQKGAARATAHCTDQLREARGLPPLES